MSRKQIFFYTIVLTVVILFFAPVAFTGYSYKIPGIRTLRILVDTQISMLMDRFRVLGSLMEVGQKNIELEGEIARLRIGMILTEGIKRENEELSKLLKIKDTYNRFAIIPARILSYSTTDPNRITVHFAAEHGKQMAQNAAVVSSMGLVGVVRSFDAVSADVELITSKQFNVPAMLESREECTALLSGNGQSLSIRFLDKVCDTPPASGAKLLSANLAQNYSLPYLPLALIGGLEPDETNILFLKGEAIPLFRKGKLNHLFIIVGVTAQDEKLYY